MCNAVESQIKRNNIAGLNPFNFFIIFYSFIQNMRIEYNFLIFEIFVFEIKKKKN
jgi:hypothetical protein